MIDTMGDNRPNLPEYGLGPDMVDQFQEPTLSVVDTEGRRHNIIMGKNPKLGWRIFSVRVQSIHPEVGSEPGYRGADARTLEDALDGVGGRQFRDMVMRAMRAISQPHHSSSR